LGRLRETEPSLPRESFLPLDHDADLHVDPPPLDTLPHPRPNGAAMSGPDRPRLLLLVPTTTYRTEDFVEAARRLDVDLVVAAEKPNALAASLPDHLLTLPFDDPSTAAALMREYARTRPIAAVVPVDDATSVVGAAIGEALGLRANAPAAVRATRDKEAMRGALARAGVRQAGFGGVPWSADPRVGGTAGRLPCELTPHRLVHRQVGGGDASRRCRSVRRHVDEARFDPRRSRGAGVGGGGAKDSRGGLHPRCRGRAGGPPDGGPPQYPGHLRQAGSARWTVFRGNHLR